MGTLSVWESKWDMQLNPSKCQVVQVTGSKSKKQLNQNILSIMSIYSSWRLSLVPVTLVMMYLETPILSVLSAEQTGPYVTSAGMLDVKAEIPESQSITP